MKPEFLGKFKILFLLFLLLPSFLMAQQREITGTVTDEGGVTLPGVTVVVAGTVRGTTTNVDGTYSINVSPGETLVFSFIGMQEQRVEIADQRVVNISLISAVETLDEVIVVGYGVQKKETVVGAVSQVSGDRLQTMKMGGSVENNLQGRLPGLTVLMQDPTPGEEANRITMRIRGTASMGDNTPLIIVDGVERPFSNIDPNEIASISILKDASATAVYGVKGANGVIIVNTKRGRKGAVQLEFSSQVSIKEPARLPQMMGAYDLLSMRNIAYKNDGLWDRIYSDEVLEHYRTGDDPYKYVDFDWMDWIFEPAVDQTYNLNARGGNDFVQYFASVSYLTEGDVFNLEDAFPYEFPPKNGSYYHNRYNFRNNLDFNLTETTKLAINLGGNIKIWNKPDDTYTHELWFEPRTTRPYYPEEAIQQYPDDRIPYNQTGKRPMIDPDQGNVRLFWLGGRGFYRNKQSEIQSSISLQQDLSSILDGLSVSGVYSFNGSVRYSKWYRLRHYYGYQLLEDGTWMRYNEEGREDLDSPQNNLEYYSDALNGMSRSHYYELKGNYVQSFGKHNVGATGIFSRRQSRGISDFPHYEENWVGRATYNYDDRYLFEASVAHTGSEKFAPGLRFGTFPAFAGGWIMSNERFWKATMPWFNNFKMKYSWGKVGSDSGISRWLYVSEYTAGGGSVGFGYPLQGYSFIQEGNIPVTDATWEEAIKQNLGFEMGFFQNLITVNLDLFNESRINILQSRRTVPAWVGVSSIQGNIGETKGHGYELELGFYKMFANDLVLMGGVTFTGQESRLVYYDESEVVPYNLKAEGKPVEVADRMDNYTPTHTIQCMGFYQTFDELFLWPVAAAPRPAIVGDFKYLDYNGDGLVDDQDRIVSQNPYVPDITWSANLGVSYKGWSAMVDFYGISSTDYPMRQGGMFYLYPYSQNKETAMEIHGDHWTPENRNAMYPNVHHMATSQYNYQINSFAVLDGKYFRLKNARLGYQLQANALKSIGVNRMDIFFTGTNLLTWTALPKGMGGDPEGFNWGVDFGAYPQLRRYSFEVRITF